MSTYEVVFIGNYDARLVVKANNEQDVRDLMNLLFPHIGVAQIDRNY